MYIILEGGDASDNLSNFLNLKFKLEEKSNIQGNTRIHTIIRTPAHFKRNGDTKIVKCYLPFFAANLILVLIQNNFKSNVCEHKDPEKIQYEEKDIFGKLLLFMSTNFFVKYKIHPKYFGRSENGVSLREISKCSSIVNVFR